MVLVIERRKKTIKFFDHNKNAGAENFAGLAFQNRSYTLLCENVI